MEVKYLWAQEAHKDGRFQVLKIAGDRNPADVLTKPKNATDMRDMLEMVGARSVKRYDWLKISGDSSVRWADVELEDFDDFEC